jgi:CRP-like cAMP-binding protein
MLQSQLPIMNKLLSALPRSEYQRLSSNLEPQELTAGQLLTQPGEPLTHVYFPATALLSLLALVDQTDVFAVGLIGNEGMSGVACTLGSQISPFRTLVQSSGQAMRMKTKLFVKEFRDSVALRDVVLKYVFSLTEQIAQTAGCTRYHVIEARLARFLLMTRDRLSSDHFHMTHEMLGQLMGVRRVGVTNAACALKDRHLIDYNRGSITILDGLGLEAAACACYQMVEGRHGKA